MLRGIFSKGQENPVTASAGWTAAPQSMDGMANPHAPRSNVARPSPAANRGPRWPWDGEPDYGACNFALRHLSRDLPDQLQVDGRVHAETCLAAIGAIAGFAAQHALITHLNETGDAASLKQVHTVSTITGGHFFFGEPLDRALLPVSRTDADGKLWSVAAGGAIAAGVDASRLPDPRQMFAHVVNRFVGTREGLPCVPERHLPQMPVKPLLRRVWPVAVGCFTGRPRNMPGNFGAARTKFWPAIAAHAASALIRQTRSAVDPRTALVIVMESGIYASKLTPAVLKTA